MGGLGFGSLLDLGRDPVSLEGELPRLTPTPPATRSVTTTATTPPPPDKSTSTTQETGPEFS